MLLISFHNVQSKGNMVQEHQNIGHEDVRRASQHGSRLIEALSRFTVKLEIILLQLNPVEPGPLVMNYVASTKSILIPLILD